MKVIITSFLVLFQFTSTMAQYKTLDAYFSKLDPEVGVSMQVMDTLGEVLYSKDDSITVVAASTIKIPILLELYFQVAQRKIKTSENYRLKEADKVGGSGDLQYKNPETKLTINDLALEMISVSDNTATNILIDKLGQDNINGRLAFQGFEKTKLRRKMMDFNAVLEGKENTTSAEEMNKLLLLIYQQEVLKPKFHQAMLSKLLACEDYTTFPAKLPGVPIAHKTGTLTSTRADVGIIYGSKPIILSVFVQNFESYLQAEAILADIAEIVYQVYCEG
jgi:beta-lactamase class A